MVDIHTHILPGMDDGSKNTDMSIEMLRRMKAYGLDEVVATPHFYAEKESMDSFLKRRENCIEHLKRKYTDDLPKVGYGAEVAFFEGISRAKNIERLCISGTNLFLLEMPFCHFDERIYKEVKTLSKREDLQIILAHVERYPSFQKAHSYYEDVLNLDVICQCNAHPLTEFFKRGSVIKLFESNRVQLLASDCHNLENRAPNLDQGRMVLEKKLGKEFIEKMDVFSHELIKDMDCI